MIRTTLVLLLFTAAALAQAPVPPPASTDPVFTTIDGVEMYAVGFDRLAAFEYVIVDVATGATADEIAEARKRDQVPGWIRRYDGQRIALTGYMLPLAVENGLARKFIMMRDVTTCCFGNVPNMNEYVIVTMQGAGVKAVQDIPVLLTGIFRIEEKYENGYVVSLYQMDGEKLVGPARK